MIEEFAKQFSYMPVVRNALAHTHHSFVIGGMGGSAVAGEAVAYLLPKTDIRVHHEYGVPPFANPHALYIAISYSGDTEETLRFASEALREGRTLAVVASGGKLGNLAERHSLPYASVPEGLAPRNALLYQVRAALALMGADRALKELEQVEVDAHRIAEDADEDAHFILPSVPLFYSSTANACLAHIWKILMNESARLPAFVNVFPELNHNEIQSFDEDMPEGLRHTFRFVLIKDEEDGERILTRMDAFARLMHERGHTVRMIDVSNWNRGETLAFLWLRALVAARLLAETRGFDPDTQPLIDEFKRNL